MNTFVDFIQTIPALKTGNDNFFAALGNLESIYSDHPTIAKGTVAEKHPIKSLLVHRQSKNTVNATLRLMKKRR